MKDNLRLIKSLLIVLVFLIFSSFCTSSKNDFVSIFDGKTLSGWHAVPEDCLGDWTVKNGVIYGLGSEDRLAYLVYDDVNLRDFEIKFSYRLPQKGNTGLEIRCRIDTTDKRPFEGYHADVGHVGIGPGILGAWDFHFTSREEYDCKRGTSLLIDSEGNTEYSSIPDALQPEDVNKHQWNEVHIIAKGMHFKYYINGILSSEFTDNYPEALTHGAIGLQIHDKGGRIEFKDIFLKRL